MLGIADPGYVVVIPPLKSVGRLYHNSIAKDAYAPPGITPLFTTPLIYQSEDSGLGRRKSALCIGIQYVYTAVAVYR